MESETLLQENISQLDQHSKILALPDGRMVAVYSARVYGRHEVFSRYSADNGLTWSEPKVEIILNIDGKLCSLVEATTDLNGELYLFYMFLREEDPDDVVTLGEAERQHVKKELADHQLNIWFSKTDMSRTCWSQPIMIWQGYCGSLNSSLVTRNNRILVPFSWATRRNWRSDRGEGPMEYSFYGQFNSQVLYSDDRGENWQLSNHIIVPVPDITYAYGACEPVVVELADGLLWMLIRTQKGRFYESFSRDGALWSDPKPTTITSSDSPAGLVKLHDGRIVLFWNNCQRYPYAYGGRQAMHAAISNDAGRTWQGCREVVRDPKRNEPPPRGGDFGSGYPYPAVTPDNMIILNTGQGTGRRIQKRIDPRWLLQKRQEADFNYAEHEWWIVGTKGVKTVPDSLDDSKMGLALRKVEKEWVSATLWNFPAGCKGRLTLTVDLKKGTSGFKVGLTDHFSVPFDQEDRFYNLFNAVFLTEATKLADIDRLDRFGSMILESGRRYCIQFEWDCAENRRCKILINGQCAGSRDLQHASWSGVSYVRLGLLEENIDVNGIVVVSAAAEVE